MSTITLTGRAAEVTIPIADWEAALAAARWRHGSRETPEAAARGQVLGRVALALSAAREAREIARAAPPSEEEVARAALLRARLDAVAEHRQARERMLAGLAPPSGARLGMAPPDHADAREALLRQRAERGRLCAAHAALPPGWVVWELGP